MNRRLASTVTALVAGLTLFVTACGVPLDDSPQAIDRTTTTQPQVVPAGPATDNTVSVYFIQNGRLVDQQVPAGDDASITEAVTAVLKKPEPPLQTQIPAGTDLIGSSIEGTTAIIELSDDIQSIEGEPQKQAYAQLVFTALASGRVDRVTFLVAGEPVAVPADNGARDVVTAADYGPSLTPR